MRVICVFDGQSSRALLYSWGEVMAQSSSAGASSNSVLWMMVAVVCVIVVLLGAGIFASSRVISSISAPAGSGNLTAHTPSTDFRVQHVNDVGPGLPLYPHAVLLLPGTNGAEAAPQKSNPSLQTTTYYTEDTRDLVDSWYLQHLNSEFVRHTPGDAQTPPDLNEVTVPPDSIVFFGKRGNQIRMAILSPNSSGTKITLLRFTNRPAE